MNVKLKLVIRCLTRVNYDDNVVFWRLVCPILFPRHKNALFVDFTNNKGFIFAPSRSEASSSFKLMSALISVMSNLERDGLIYVSNYTEQSGVSLAYGESIVLDSQPLPSRYESKNDGVIIDEESATSFSLRDGDSVMCSYELPKQLFLPLSRYLFSIIFPTNELDKYVSLGFMTEDKYHTKKALRISRVAIVIALLIGILTPIVSVIISNYWGVTTLNEEQLALIINAIVK